MVYVCNTYPSSIWYPNFLFFSQESHSDIFCWLHIFFRAIEHELYAGGVGACAPPLPWLILYYISSKTEAEFLDEIQTKVLGVFLLANYSHSLQICIEIYISSNSRNLLQFVLFTVKFLYTVKEKGGKPVKKPHHLPHSLRNPYRNLKADKSQDYAKQPQLNCTFMNSASCLAGLRRAVWRFFSISNCVTFCAVLV